MAALMHSRTNLRVLKCSLCPKRIWSRLGGTGERGESGVGALEVMGELSVELVACGLEELARALYDWWERIGIQTVGVQTHWYTDHDTRACECGAHCKH
jgi:hypothetical protein